MWKAALRKELGKKGKEKQREDERSSVPPFFVFNYLLSSTDYFSLLSNYFHIPMKIGLGIRGQDLISYFAFHLLSIINDKGSISD